MIMAQISCDDIVMATATLHGTEVAAFTSTGFASVSEVVRAVMCGIGSAFGMIELTLRNTSRGWSERRSLFVRAPAPGRQLTLF